MATQRPVRSIPTAQGLRSYDVVRRDSVEGIKQSLYDRLTYAAAGQPSLDFFQVPQGQGAGIAGGVKTLEDTNMELAGNLPNPKAFLLQGIELAIVPFGLPVRLDTDAPTLPQMTNDMWTILSRGWLELFISSKMYLQEAPLLKFPSRNFLRADFAATATNEAAPTMVTMELPVSAGQPFKLVPPITLRPTMNFRVSAKWSSNVALPSTQPAQVVCNLTGLLYRNGQ